MAHLNSEQVHETRLEPVTNGYQCAHCQRIVSAIYQKCALDCRGKSKFPLNFIFLSFSFSFFFWGQLHRTFTKSGNCCIIICVFFRFILSDDIVFFRGGAPSEGHQDEDEGFIDQGFKWTIWYQWLDSIHQEIFTDVWCHKCVTLSIKHWKVLWILKHSRWLF